MKKLPTLKELEGKYKPKELKDLTDEEVLKVFEGVETVWDHNPTKEEKRMVGMDRFKNKVEFFRYYGYRKDNILNSLAHLFIMRNNNDKADTYIKHITDETLLPYLYKAKIGHV
jgi:hypothetical protein